MNYTLWRYFDLLKFIDLISGNLHFCRADIFEDRFEGRYPKTVIEEISQVFEYNPCIKGTEVYNRVEEGNKKFMSTIRNQEIKWKECVAISCWHLNDYESAAMWGQYAKFGYGIAVKTTINKLGSIKVPNEYICESFPVTYIDYENGFKESGLIKFHQLSRFQFKRKSFEHENEYRIMLYKPTDSNEIIKFNEHRIPVLDNLDVLSASGISMKIDAKEVIDEIILAPYLKEWECNIIDKLVNKYGFNCRKSYLLDEINY